MFLRISSFISDGVPSKTTFPSFSPMIRSENSWENSRLWLFIRTVTPSFSWISFKSVRICRPVTGSRDAAGLVGQENLWMTHEGSRYGGALFLTAGDFFTGSSAFSESPTRSRNFRASARRSFRKLRTQPGKIPYPADRR